MTDLVSIGECMVELSRRGDGMSLGYGGDTFNTAVYAARLGLDVAYATALGDDPYSQAIADLARMDSDDGLLTRDILAVDMRIGDRIAIQLSPDADKARQAMLKQKPFKRRSGANT